MELSTNIQVVSMKGLSRLYFLRSFGVCNQMLLMFILRCHHLCCDTGIWAKEANRPNKLMGKADAVFGSRLASLKEVRKQRMLMKLLAIMDNTSNPFNDTEQSQLCMVTSMVLQEGEGGFKK